MRLPRWWPRTKTLLVGVLGLVLLCIVLNLSGALSWPNWTGFGVETGPADTMQVSVVQQQRTLWDWLELLIVPLAVVGAAGWLNLVQQRREDRSAERREWDSVLDTYLGQTANLLLHEDLRGQDANGKNAQDVARAQTLTALRRLDGARKGTIIEFLSDSGLLPIIDLKGADLSGLTLREGVDLSMAKLSGANLQQSTLIAANFGDADLSWANLTGTMLYRCKLVGANLAWANLTDAQVGPADLSRANLGNANLARAYLRGVTFQGAQLQGARAAGAWLRQANLLGADLNGIDLRDAELVAANLTAADLSHADLDRANLVNAFLEDAVLTDADLNGADLSCSKGTTQEQLGQSQSLAGALMPDGTRHPGVPDPVNTKMR